jgi:molybdate transport system ATP-binding protein
MHDMKKPVVQINNLSLKYQSKLVLKDVAWTINSGENWLLNGESGSGKSTLVKLIAAKEDECIQLNFDPESKFPAKALYVENWYQFKNIEGQSNFYYQQRYVSQQAKDIHTVQTEFEAYGIANQLDFTALGPILSALGFINQLNATLIELSSGEHKKMQLVKALWLKPQLLILDEPYTGLDTASRQNLNELLTELAECGVQLILITTEENIPICINRFAILKDLNIEVKAIQTTNFIAPRKQQPLPSFLTKSPNYTSYNLVKMSGVNISYGEKQILKNINWEVNAGEKWLLQGHNGSGKSTLLSLINGDHPQAYANNIYLFGNKRGTGESIWDIKKHIGLISPEFHWYFDSSATVWESIASGLNDTVGLFTTLVDGKKVIVDELVKYFDLEEVKDELLNLLPLGKQRLALLARTIIKNPELLVLDEPCQGLDRQQTKHFNELVDELCSNGMTLIYVAHTEAQLPQSITHRIVLQQGEVLNIKDYKTQKELA